MGTDIYNNNSSGADAIKGGVFFGSNLTANGIFSNIPNTTQIDVQETVLEPSLVLTLAKYKEQLLLAAQQNTGSNNSNLLSQATYDTLSTFITTYVQLLIDYSDLRNFVFFGSSYNELVYHINKLSNTYPFKSYFGCDVTLGKAITLNYINSNTQVVFRKQDVIETANYVFDISGKTIWPNFTLVDSLGEIFPILSISNSINLQTITSNGSGVVTVQVDKNVHLINGDKVTLSEIAPVFLPDINSTWVIANLDNTNPSYTTFTLVNFIGPTNYTYTILPTSNCLTDNIVTLFASGIISDNNLVPYYPSTSTDVFEGLFISPQEQVLIDFETNLEPPQKTLLSVLNPTPWPRSTLTNNIYISGTSFDTWISNPNNMVSGQLPTNVGLETTNVGLNLTGALTLDSISNSTNQLLLRCIPQNLVDEMGDPDNGYFTRFVLLAGKMFDVIKTYIDFLQYCKTVNYSQFNQLSPEFYNLYAQHYGFNLFDEDNIDLAQATILTEPGLKYTTQFEPVYTDYNNSKTLKELQQEKQKRLLVSLFYLYSKKGSIKSIQYLTRLLGSPLGLVIVQEFYFDRDLKLKLVQNDKIEVPKLNYEIDPDYLVNPSNKLDPVNIPYVYRLKLDNEQKINLRELSIDIDPNNAILQSMLEYGQSLFPYGHMTSGSYANLQNSTQDYFLLPLFFPDKYCGVTSEFMIPNSGFKKGVGQNFDEATVHLGSLFKTSIPLSIITYPNGEQGPKKIPAGTQYRYSLPGIFQESVTSTSYNNDNLTVSSKAIFQFNGNHGSIGDSLTLELYDSLGVLLGTIASTTWQASIKDTAISLVNAVNFTVSTPLPHLKATLSIDPGGSTYTVTVEEDINSLPVLAANSRLVVSTDGMLDITNISSSQTTYGYIPFSRNNLNVESDEFIIARIEGNDLVVRLKLVREVTFPFLPPIIEERVAFFENCIVADGLTHQLRLLYRPEGVEITYDYNYIGIAPWLDVTGGYTALTVPKSLILTSTQNSLSSRFLFADPTHLNADKPHWWDLFIGYPVNLDIYFSKVAVFDELAVNQADILDEIDLDNSGNEVEKYSFNFLNQLQQINGSYYTDRLNVTCTFRQGWPLAPDAIVNQSNLIELFFKNNYPAQVSDITLINYGSANFLQDLQSYYKMPDGTLLTLDSMFKYNFWSSTLHTDYDYSIYYTALQNYQVFSQQVLTYLSLLPFITLIETKFKSVVSQFIPIVINLYSFGEVINQNFLKVRYPRAQYVCLGYYRDSSAVGSFRIVHGNSNIYSPIMVSIDGNITGLVWIQAWTSSNTHTALLIANQINSSPNYPYVQADTNINVNQNTVIIYVNPTWFKTTYGYDINSVHLDISTMGSAGVDTVRGMAGGQIGTSGNDCLQIWYSVSTPLNNNKSLYVFWVSELSYDNYIFEISESKPPRYIY